MRWKKYINNRKYSIRFCYIRYDLTKELWRSSRLQWTWFQKERTFFGSDLFSIIFRANLSRCKFVWIIWRPNSIINFSFLDFVKLLVEDGKKRRTLREHSITSQRFSYYMRHKNNITWVILFTSFQMTWASNHGICCVGIIFKRFVNCFTNADLLIIEIFKLQYDSCFSGKYHGEHFCANYLLDILSQTFCEEAES